MTTVHLRRTSWLAQLSGAIRGRLTSVSDDHRFGTDAPHPTRDALAGTARRKRLLDCDGCCVMSESRP